ncbi:oxidoreductase-like domain-containing protein [Hydrogenophaga sp.]|uniref:oxidoreductase-like domain-containing protein n=1 Tax=Hydrogenophaga sp. TaxID=1904254 RepID=UPI00271D2DE4|nr:oxidoreductase-like domain-containing protein [Hydrogenophaga sp.]MDO8903594.1 oxidoreductase-like domain-containing protein [Hydrogenophaga sp.]
MNLDTALRPPPTEPTTCCERGCNGCVWEGFYNAMGFWRDDAIELIINRTDPPAPAAPPAGSGSGPAVHGRG